jgi:hypothetical protein
MIKRMLILSLVFCCAATIARTQTLAEAAKKEKERREALQGRAPVVVTNADLAKTKKKPAVPAVQAESPDVEETPRANPPGFVPAGTSGAPTDLLNESRRESEARKSDLKTKWAAARERLDLLNLKMLALRQQYFSFNSMTPKDQIQKEISETSLKLQAATAEEAKLRSELDAAGSSPPRPIIK